MENKVRKEDLRVKKSKQAIKEAFIELVEIKGFDKVSVCDIATKANINRNTFYLHYEDKEDLIRKILSESVGKVYNKLVGYNISSFDKIDETQIHWGIRNLLRLIEPEMELYRIIILDKTVNGYFATVSNSIKEALIKMLDVRNPRSNLVFQYAFSGMMGVIQQWIVYSPVDLTITAKLLAKMAYSSLEEFRTEN